MVVPLGRMWMDFGLVPSLVPLLVCLMVPLLVGKSGRDLLLADCSLLADRFESRFDVPKKTLILVLVLVLACVYL